MNVLRIMLADDHPALREGLALLIDSQPDMTVVDQVGDGRSLLQRLQQCEVDIVLLDIAMPDLNGIQTMAKLREACPRAKVIVLTRHSEPGYVREMLHSGAQGYVLKQTSSHDLLGAIRSVASGGTYLDASITGQLVTSIVGGQDHNTSTQSRGLSEREADIVRQTAFGYTNKEVAARLGLSVKTVDTYKARAMEKLGLHGRAALVRYALDQGWFEET